MGTLTEQLALKGLVAPSRVVFGPHETNLGRDRAFGERHVAYYEARAAGGAGIVVTETASVHPSDWPYERAPLAEAGAPGWREIADACHRHGALVLAGLGHAGGQGSSAYSQSALWAPSRVADAASRELPMEMADAELHALVEGFAAAAATARAAGLDGVEVDAGPFALLRQFHSGLTNLRDDRYGTDRLLLTREVLGAVRGSLGTELLLGLRLCCDELAPWAGVTPDQAARQVAELADLVDLVVVVRGGPYSTSAYRPDGHTPATCNLELCQAMRDAADGQAAVVLQGSVVDPATAQEALDAAACDLVEMTRAQIADPRLVALVREGAAERIRPCILCNQACRSRDDRNPIVSCVGEPRSGYETVEPTPEGHDEPARTVLVVGGGVAGLECARVLAARGHRVTIAERTERLGGMARTAAVGAGRERLATLAAWLEAECRRGGVTVETGRNVTGADVRAAIAAGVEVVLATGSCAAPLGVPVDGSCLVLDAPELLAAGADGLAPGPVVVHDPIGGPIGVGVAEWLADAGRDVRLVTQDQVAGTLLSRTGDLADANVRLQRAGVRRELRTLLRGVEAGRVVLEDRWTGEQRRLECAVLVDCGHRLPDESFADVGVPRAGDCVAPRTILEAVLEGRRRALELAVAPPDRRPALAGSST